MVMRVIVLMHLVLSERFGANEIGERVRTGLAQIRGLEVGSWFS
jgi:hypothetical protein